VIGHLSGGKFNGFRVVRVAKAKAEYRGDGEQSVRRVPATDAGDESQFATGRDRTSGAYPGGSDRSSGTDPVLTQHPAP